MLATAKHFPGHGDTDIDSHLAVPSIKSDQAHLENTELPPFRAAIAAGVDAVMVAHIMVPALDPDPHRVATISPAIVTGLLKQQMGFKGLVITDALVMRGFTNLFAEGGSAARRPRSCRSGQGRQRCAADSRRISHGSYNGLLQAVRSGEIPESRIDESVLKILRAKASVGLNKATQVDINAVNHIVATPESLAKAQEIADDAVTLVRDNHHVLPLKAAAKGTNSGQNPYPSSAENLGKTLLLIFTDDVRSDSGWMLEHQLRARIPDAKVIYIDPRNAALWTQSVQDAVSDSATVVAAVYLSPQGGAPSNKSALQSGPAALLQAVMHHAADKTVVISMGNPYLAAQIPQVQNYLCTFSDAQVSEMSAVKAIFGEISYNRPLAGNHSRHRKPGRRTGCGGGSSAWRRTKMKNNLLEENLFALIAASAALLLVGACSINVDDKDKKNAKVDIQTPFANLKVDSGEQSGNNGIPVYPGAHLRPKEDGDSHSANINIGAAGFGLKVIAAEYETDDSPEKVKAFYTDKMKVFGTTLVCRDTAAARTFISRAWATRTKTGTTKS